jgi:LacI family transcriptional regulator
MKPRRSPAVPEQTLVSSREVVVRASTDIFAIDDPVVADALRYIRNEACNDIGVEDVVARTPVCRSLLERRFRQALDRSIHREILRVRLEKACGLLRSTEYGLEPIAEYTGFKSAVYLSQVFRRELGVAPGQWRQQNTFSRI